MAEPAVEDDYSSEESMEEDEEETFAKLDSKQLGDIAGSPIKTPFKPKYKNYTFLFKGNVREGTKVLSLPHPAKNTRARWIINDQHQLLEVQKCSSNSSWFVNNRIIEDGTLYLTSAVDPLFFLLPRLEKLRKSSDANTGVFVSAEQIWIKDDLDWSLLRQCLQAAGGTIYIICDTKQESGDTYYKLNDDKVFEWLRRKVDNICQYVEKMPDMITLVKAQAAGVKLRKNETFTADQLITVAIGFLKEYLPPRPSPAAADADSLVYMTEDPDAANKRKRKFEATEAGSDTVTPTKKRRKLSEIQLDKVDKKNIPKLTTFFPKIK